MGERRPATVSANSKAGRFIYFNVFKKAAEEWRRRRTVNEVGIALNMS